MKSLFRRTPDPKPEAKGPAPAQTTYVVGDLHGREDLLEPMLVRIDAHIGDTKAQNPKLVFVGDYVDYGPDSRSVLDRLHQLTRELPDNVVCLMGNHERMLLDYLEEPQRRGPRWLRAGGNTTLESYGIRADDTSPEGLSTAGKALRSAMGADLINWLAARPLLWNSGTLWVVHAAADPRQPMDSQSARVLLWGHPEFETVQRRDAVWIAHGHTAIAAAAVSETRINVDSGAWRTGTLSAGAFTPDEKIEILTVSAGS